MILRASVILICILMLFTCMAFAQEGEGEGEGETVAEPAKCRITTTSDYNLPNTMGNVVETLTKTYPSVSPLTPFLGVWVKVLEWHPGDSIEVIVDNVPRTTYNALGVSPGWQLLPAVALSLSGSLEVQVRSTFNTNIADPSLVLIGAIQFLDVASVANPADPNTLQGFTYSTNLVIPGYTPPGIVTPDADMMADVGPLLPLQTQVAVLGGISGVNAPRVAVSWRYIEVENTDGETEGESGSEGEMGSEGEAGNEGEGGSGGPPTLELLYGDESLGHSVLADSGETCNETMSPITSSLLGSPGKPAVQLSIGGTVLAGARIIIDDFVLTYSPEQYQTIYPWLYRLYGNIIQNGDFESGTDPFIIEKVGTGVSNCPDINEAIQNIGEEACSPDHAIVFDLAAVIMMPQITTCEVSPEIVGKGQMLTLTLTGTYLTNILEVWLVPQLGVSGEGAEETMKYVVLNPGGDNTDEEATYTYNFNGPFNTDAEGDPLCTDGSIQGLFYTDTTSSTVKPVENCDILPLVDTVPPILDVSAPGGTNASVVSPYSPSVTIASRTVPPAMGFPAFWTPQYEVTPKNAGSFAQEDMHVYVKYADSCANTDTQNFAIQATFLDPLPMDTGGNLYNVEQAGFRGSVPQPGSISIYPDGGPGSVRLNSTIPIGSFFLTAVTEEGAPTLEALWQIEAINNSGSWLASFKFEATDRAGNLLDTSQYNSINIHWICCPKATFSGSYTASQRVIDLPWSLGRGPLPGALPACAPLAYFRVYSKDRATDYLTRQGTSDWQAGPLRENTLISGRPLRAWVDEILSNGNDVCIDIIGADEAGNVQCRAGDSIGVEGDFGGANPIAYIPIRAEDTGTKPRPNEAIDTGLRINLVHQRYVGGSDPVQTVRTYGGATRIALPPLEQACDTRVNAALEFRASLPAGSMAPGCRILWKLYQDNALVARGVTDPQAPGTVQQAMLMNLLVSCNQGYDSAELVDFDSSGNFIQESRSLDRNVYLAIPPSDGNLLSNGYGLEPCSIPAVGADMEFFRRLGDEGNPPNPDNPNWPSERRREIYYTLTAQTVLEGTNEIDLTPASVSFSVYVREVEEEVRDEAPIREFSR